MTHQLSNYQLIEVNANRTLGMSLVCREHRDGGGLWPSSN